MLRGPPHPADARAGADRRSRARAALGQRAAAPLAERDRRIDPLISDAAGLPLPKSGRLAFETGPIVTRHVARRAHLDDGAAPTPAMPNAIRRAFMGEKEAIGIHVTVGWQPGALPASQPKVDPARNATAAQGAMQWGRSMCNAMLG